MKKIKDNEYITTDEHQIAVTMELTSGGNLHISRVLNREIDDFLIKDSLTIDRQEAKAILSYLARYADTGQLDKREKPKKEKDEFLDYLNNQIKVGDLISFLEFGDECQNLHDSHTSMLKTLRKKYLGVKEK